MKCGKCGSVMRDTGIRWFCPSCCTEVITSEQDERYRELDKSMTDMGFEIRRPPGRPKTGRDKTRGLRLADAEYERMVAEANKQGLSFSEWARQQLVAALPQRPC